MEEKSRPPKNLAPGLTITVGPIRIVLLSLALISATSVAYAGIYRWVDDQGNMHFSDRRPGTADSEKLELPEINTYEGVTYDTSAYDTAVHGSGQKVVMYSTDWCGVCKKAKKYFKKNNIAFTEYNIDKNAKTRQRYKALGATGVPVILYGKKRMNGFSEAAFRRIYN